MTSLQLIIFMQNGVSYDKDGVALFNSFFVDLMITANILKSLVNGLEKGSHVKNAIKSAISCPLKKAPQTKCGSSSECEHEKIWLDVISRSE